MSLQAFRAGMSVACLTMALLSRVHADEGTMSLNSEIQVVPAPGPVKIDGKAEDWDLSAGILSYNTPQSVDKFSVWTHMMWDSRGVYFLARYADRTPMQNATRGADFGKSWTSDAYQARIIFDDKTQDEHQMHFTMFYSTPEARPYMIVNHGGFGDQNTGKPRPDLRERFGDTMEKFGGEIAARPWDDGKGYNLEAFWPWKYLRLSGAPLEPGQEFVFGLEAMWGTPDGTSSWPLQRLADGVKDEKANRVFMFRARNDWGRAVISSKGHLNIAAEQQALLARRLASFSDYKTYGSVPVTYDLPDDREVSIAIDNAQGQRVRNLFGQYPRAAGKNTDLWDGLDDAGNPVPPGRYTVSIVDHKPFTSKLFNSVYNAATPPWVTEAGRKIWGADHGFPSTVATRGGTTMVGFTGVESGAGLLKVNAEGAIQWSDRLEVLDVTLDDNFAYTLALQVGVGNGLPRVVRRLNLKTGAQTPFDDAAKSVEIALPGVSKAPLNSSIAQSGGKLFVLIPGDAARLFRLDARTGAVEKQLENPNLVAITDREEALFGLTKDGAVVRLNTDGSSGAAVFTARGLKQPARLAVSPDKTRFAISDTGANQVFEFDNQGKAVRTLGRAYDAPNAERPAGRFVETDFARPLGLDFDAQNRLWVAEASGTSRRVTCWNGQGALQKSFWGAADYGAMAGFPFTDDSTRFIAHGTEFQLDPNPNPWQRPTAEKPLLFHPELAHERGLIYRIQGREYAVTTPGYNRAGGFLIALRGKDEVFHPVVRFTYGDKGANTVWTDTDGDGQSEPGETQIGVQGQAVYWSVGWIRPDLTILTPDGLIYAPQGFTEKGVPRYDFANPVRAKNWIGPEESGGSRGTPIMDAAGNISDGIRYATVDGRRGSYPNPYNRHDAPAARRGRIIAAFRTNGVVENVPGVGSVTALGGDRGEWFVMTMDGIYLSNLWQDIKGDVTLDETYIGPESFGGFFWRAPDGKVLTQLGGNSYRLMEIQGLETVRKQQLTLDVSAAQIAEGQKLAAHGATAAAQVTALPIARVAQLPQEAPDPANWEAPLAPGLAAIPVAEAGETTPQFRAALAHDGANLTLIFQVRDSSPWKNGESRPAYSFIGGDAVDLKLDVPGRGPQRLLVAPLAGRDTAVLWQKTAARKENPQTYVVGNNMANAQNFDVVRTLPAAQIRRRVGATGYSVLVTLPLSELGLQPGAAEIKADIGVIFSDPAGANRVARVYLFDKSTGLVADVPSESSLTPARWGSLVIEK